MKIRSDSDKWLIMRGRNRERLDALEKEIITQLTSPNMEDWGVWSGLAMGLFGVFMWMLLDEVIPW